MIWALALLAALPAEDPRISLVQMQLEHRDESALVATERLLAEEPEIAHGLGLDFLRGHLLDRLGRRKEAAEAFARVLSTTPQLEPFSRFRLAADQERLGHPEVAAGLIAHVVATPPPASLAEPATALLRRALAGGGDCRLLNGIRDAQLAEGERREIDLARADCQLAAGEREHAAKLLTAIAREKATDEPAREAVERLAALLDPEPDPDLLLLLGLTLHQHRDYQRSSIYLERSLPVAPPMSGLTHDQLDGFYAMARNAFWLGRYAAAAAGFSALATLSPDAAGRALALFQEGRCHELLGNWTAASESFRRAYLAAPDGEWAAGALFAALRLEWRAGKEKQALALYDLLASRRGWHETSGRAALFLAASDLVRGNAGRAEPWLAHAAHSDSAPDLEVAYWRGRLAELTGDRPEAVGQYLRVLRAAPYHPLAQMARLRLAEPELATAAKVEGLRRAASPEPADLYAAWLLLGKEQPQGVAALTALRARLLRDRRSAPFLTMKPVPVASWPLWTATLGEPEEMLLALGIWREGEPAVGRHFPLADPSLALTGSIHLAEDGEISGSLSIAESLAKRIPAGVPTVLLPGQFRRLLFPFAHDKLIVDAAKRTGVDPFLMAAVIREESRFDPRALSAASARGLTQFIVPTARQVAHGEAALADLVPEDLYRPEVSINLGAAYLAQLAARFHGTVQLTVAAYNAGEAQARLWRSYCFSSELAEYFSKVSFGQTRTYLRKVLESRAEYAEIYALPAAPGGGAP